MTGTQVSDGTSEQDHYLIRGGVAGRQRLRVLARVKWPTTRELLGRVGVPEDARCLDVGCGGGDVTMEAPIPFELARVVLPADPAPLAFVVFAPPHRFADHGALPSPDGETTAVNFHLDYLARTKLRLHEPAAAERPRLECRRAAWCPSLSASTWPGPSTWPCCRPAWDRCDPSRIRG